ncbi:clamp loader of DNA polymerase [Salmonella phage SAP012]|uniref:Putative ribonucleotide reductase A subunit n=1 Tax=Salmonella phage SAP012 TaxID=2742114 RepID=A0A6J4EG85_9CAUD|nr:clamp loader of DNA polymerase [Salmonella phage SAP012]BCG45175.1 putative ribonucleotide reductase A subunit [Salmonella phage SAP012]
MKLFTHQYSTGTGAQVNAPSDYIAKVAIVNSDTFCETITLADGDRYVFGFWLNIHKKQIAVFKPSDLMIEAWKRSHGGLLTALMPNAGGRDADKVRFVASMRDPSSGHGFSWQAVAGDTMKADFIAFLIDQMGAEYADDIKKHFHA